MRSKLTKPWVLKNHNNLLQKFKKHVNNKRAIKIQITIKTMESSQKGKYVFFLKTSISPTTNITDVSCGYATQRIIFSFFMFVSLKLPK